MWEPRRLTTLWAATACYRNSFDILDADSTPAFFQRVNKVNALDDSRVYVSPNDPGFPTKTLHAFFIPRPSYPA
jgi:hypothetical protein